MSSGRRTWEQFATWVFALVIDWALFFWWLPQSAIYIAWASSSMLILLGAINRTDS